MMAPEACHHNREFFINIAAFEMTMGKIVKAKLGKWLALSLGSIIEPTQIV